MGLAQNARGAARTGSRYYAGRRRSRGQRHGAAELGFMEAAFQRQPSPPEPNHLSGRPAVYGHWHNARLVRFSRTDYAALDAGLPRQTRGANDFLEQAW